MKHRAALGACLGVLGACVSLFERDASACGGCFTPPPPPSETESVITDEKMIFSVSKDQTTLYDEITYAGAPSSFAWVLPIKGTVTVGLSADILFATIDQLTATQVVAPALNCGGSYCAYYGSGGGGGGDAGGGGDTGGGGGVTVTGQQQVGPYETVQLKSPDGSALTAWLSSHGYAVPSADAPVIAAYVEQGFDFLALKLVPGAGVQAMQPVRVTSQGASVSLPLHMVAVGTGATTGITVWVVADGRWEPQNFPTFTIADTEIVWDWTTSSSNYETLRLSKEAALGGRGWQIESSLELAQAAISQAVVTNAEFGGPQGNYSPLGDGGTSEAGPFGPYPYGDEAGPGDEAGFGDGADGAAATADLAVLFAGLSSGNARITRMRSDVAHAALSVDMILGAATDQAELTNLHYPTKTTGDAGCPPVQACPEMDSEAGCCSDADDASCGDAACKPGKEGGCNSCNAAGSDGDARTTVGIFAAILAALAASSRRRRRRAR